MKAVPAIFFPSTAIIIDDNNTVIDFLKENLDKTNVNILYAQNTQEAQNLISVSNSEIPNLESILVESFQDDLYDNNSSIVKFDISKLLNLFYNHEQYKFISIVISDHIMPGESGLEFFKKIRTLRCKKILITGQVTYDKVVEAFNWSIIDRYVMKNDINIINTLNLYIKELLFDYFLNISKNIHLTNTGFNLLEDNEFIQTFTKIINDYSISSFCVIDKSCSFILVDRFNKKYVLIMRHDNDLEEFLQIYCNRLPENYINSIKSRELIPFLGINADNDSFNAKSIHRLFFKANRLSEHQNYYWSIMNVEE